MSNITDASGQILAVTPGPNVSCSPRGGDGVSIGVHLGQAERNARRTGVHTGFTKMMNGTSNIRTAMVFDKGYVYQPRVNTGSNPTLIEYCHRNDILPLYRSETGGMAFVYNRQTDRLEQIQNNPDDYRAANSGRITTFLRPASENAHTFKNQYRFFGHKAHNSRLNAVGARKIDYYNRLYGKNYGPEWREKSKLDIEYLVMVGRYNEWHPMYPR